MPCTICGGPTDGVGLGDPSGIKEFRASACAEHKSEVQRKWMQWCHDNARRVLPPEARFAENRDWVPAGGAGGNRNEQKPSRGVPADASSTDGQGVLI